MDIDEPPVPLPCAAAREISTGVLLQPPLSRRGHGPGLIIILPQNLELDENQQTLDPPPLLKWAEEGYAVVKIQLSNRADEQRLSDAIRIGVDALTGLQECDVKDKFGLVRTYVEIISVSSAVN